MAPATPSRRQRRQPPREQRVPPIDGDGEVEGHVRPRLQRGRGGEGEQVHALGGEGSEGVVPRGEELTDGLVLLLGFC